jgi:hemin uptake protein HemP
MPQGDPPSNLSDAPRHAATNSVFHSGAAESFKQALPIASTNLLKGHKTVQIQHNGFLYTLQATKLGKLILTK